MNAFEKVIAAVKAANEKAKGDVNVAKSLDEVKPAITSFLDAVTAQVAEIQKVFDAQEAAAKADADARATATTAAKAAADTSAAELAAVKASADAAAKAAVDATAKANEATTALKLVMDALPGGGNAKPPKQDPPPEPFKP